MKCPYCRKVMTIRSKEVEYRGGQKAINARAYCSHCGSSGPVVEGTNEGVVQKYAVIAQRLKGKRRKDYHTPLWLLEDRGDD